MSRETEAANLVVRRALETDIDRLMEVQFSAFENDPYHEALFPGPHHSPLVRKVAGQRTLDDWRNTPFQDMMVCTNAQTGKILGFASWNFYLSERPREEWEKMPSITWAEGKEKKQAEAFLGATARMRMKIWEGRPHIRKCWIDWYLAYATARANVRGSSGTPLCSSRGTEAGCWCGFGAVGSEAVH
jgi:hypothetical protein